MNTDNAVRIPRPVHGSRRGAGIPRVRAPKLLLDCGGLRFRRALSTGQTYDDYGRLTFVREIPNNQLVSGRTWNYDTQGRIVQETLDSATTKFLLDGEGLRFRRVKASGAVEYTVYGFSREPLMVLNSTTTTALKTASRTLAPAASTTTTTSLGGDVTPPEPPPTDPHIPPVGYVGAWIDAPTDGTTLYVGQAVQFKGSTESGTAFNWNFGDATTATGAQPVKTFTKTGTYTVTLTVVVRQF